MSITNNSNGNNNGTNNNENNRKSKENLRELSYLIEEERLLADLKRKSEETLQKLKVEELTLLRFVRGLADANGGANKPIMLPDSPPASAPVVSSGSVVTNGNGAPRSDLPASSSIQTPVAGLAPTTSTTTATNTGTNPTISTIEQNVNNTEVLKLNVDNILMTMNDQENEIEMDDEN